MSKVQEEGRGRPGLKGRAYVQAGRAAREGRYLKNEGAVYYWKGQYFKKNGI